MQTRPPDVEIPVEAVNDYGDADELARIGLTDDGLFLSTSLDGGVGLSWESLVRLLRRREVQERLMEAEMYLNDDR